MTTIGTATTGAGGSIDTGTVGPIVDPTGGVAITGGEAITLHENGALASVSRQGSVLHFTPVADWFRVRLTGGALLVATDFDVSVSGASVLATHPDVVASFAWEAGRLSFKADTTIDEQVVAIDFYAMPADAWEVLVFPAYQFVYDRDAPNAIAAGAYPAIFELPDEDGLTPQAWEQWFYAWNRSDGRGMLCRCTGFEPDGKRLVYAGGLIQMTLYGDDEETFGRSQAIHITPVDGGWYDAAVAVGRYYRLEGHPGMQAPIAERTDQAHSRNACAVLWLIGEQQNGDVPDIPGEFHKNADTAWHWANFMKSNQDETINLVYRWHANDFFSGWPDFGPIDQRIIDACATIGMLGSLVVYTVPAYVDVASSYKATTAYPDDYHKDRFGAELTLPFGGSGTEHANPTFSVRGQRMEVIDTWLNDLLVAFPSLRGVYLDANALGPRDSYRAGQA